MTGKPGGGPVRKWLFFVLRLAVSALLLWWLFKRLGVGMHRLGDLDPVMFWGAAVFFATATVLGATQWTLILRHVGITVPRSRLHFLYWVGLFFNNFLPTNVGGDLVKVGDVAVEEGSLLRPVAATLLDRLLGLLALVILAIGASLALGGASPAGVPWWILAGVAVVVIGVLFVLLSRRMGALLLALVARLAPPGRGKRLSALLEEFKAFRVAPGFLFRVLALALLVQSLRIFTHVVVAWELHIPLDPRRILEFFVLIPILGMAIVLPLSFNGLGIREWVATRLMPAVGIPAEDAFVLELATYLVQVAVSVVGGILFAWKMIGGWRRRSVSST